MENSVVTASFRAHLGRAAYLLIILSTASGCGGSTSSAGGAGGGGGAGASGGGGTGGNPECTNTNQCVPPEVCEPVRQVCISPGAPCASQAECTGGTYCEATANVCLPSAVGTPCAGPDNCNGECLNGFCGCSGVAHERQLESSPLDIYLVLDRTASMGNDCAYVAGNSPPVNSKACYATYALADYLIGVSPAVDTSLAFNVMSLSNDCTGASYDPALIGKTSLPVASNSALVQRISDENFSGGYGTRIEGALRGIANYTANNQTPGREMIGVLITDGDATNCDTNNSNLAGIIADHLASTGLRTFIIGMNGASENKLEELAMAGGADPHDDFCGGLTPPCHYWNVGDASGDVLANALQAISQQAVPLPCEIDVTGLTAPEGEVLDYGRVNVTLTEGETVTIIPQTSGAGACPANQPAWYYDVPSAPTKIDLCPYACDAVSAAGDGAQLNVVAGCTDTVIVVQ
ncbi:MAG: vWA domain-containing protein [Polyangiales bacterium]